MLGSGAFAGVNVTDAVVYKTSSEHQIREGRWIRDMNSITLTQALRDTTNHYGWLGALVFPLALLRVIFTR